MRNSRPIVFVVSLLLIAVLAASITGCGSNKKRRHSSSGPVAAATTTSSSAFRTCEDAWAAGRAPLRRQDPGYSTQLDRQDGKEDGVACLVRPTTAPR
ncbi:excalibur calcium-binding domain-containing protein [Nocardia lijiangensis]|uniref:excalibur calcium-binding domain-containing protein n=1 Tax=Nocardia lijiangensis TaxID=299618 RepID=UPI000A07155A|nr:excalibur calcium-binding domain-containing protein [Nocardia lijiangensis]